MPSGYDFHVLLMAPELSAPWFMQAARRYWLRFQPLVTDRIELLACIPATATLAVTLLVPSGSLELMQKQIDATRANAALDIVLADDLPMLEAALNARAEAGKPFGQRRTRHESA